LRKEATTFKPIIHSIKLATIIVSFKWIESLNFVFITVHQCAPWESLDRKPILTSKTSIAQSLSAGFGKFLAPNDEV